MKKLLLVAVMFLALASIARAEFPSDVTILDKSSITKLSDDQLVDAYEDTIVEIDANRTFHATSGFSPKEYKDFKALLKYRLLLLVEIHSRNLEMPQF